MKTRILTLRNLRGLFLVAVAMPLIWRPVSSFSASAATPMIVMVRTAEHSTEVPRDHGISADAIWDTAVMGFAARLSSAQVRKLKGDNRVLVVEPDLTVTTMEHGPRHVHATLHTNTFETLTSGIARIGADLNPRTDV